jgi:hypothetical protein
MIAKLTIAGRTRWKKAIDNNIPPKNTRRRWPGKRRPGKRNSGNWRENL